MGGARAGRGPAWAGPQPGRGERPGPASSRVRPSHGRKSPVSEVTRKAAFPLACEASRSFLSQVWRKSPPRSKLLCTHPLWVLRETCPLCPRRAAPDQPTREAAPARTPPPVADPVDNGGAWALLPAEGRTRFPVTPILALISEELLTGSK